MGTSRRTARLFGPGLVIIFTAASGLPAQMASAAGEGQVVAAPVAAASSAALAAVRIGNFGKVNDNYYRGEQPQGDEYRQLAALGVKTVIDLQTTVDRDEKRLVEAAGMRYENIPMTASRAPTRVDVERFLALVNDAAGQPVYVHCAAGRHRTGAMTALYRMTNDGWTADQAYAEMKEYKFKMPLNFLLGKPEMKKFVYGYYNNMQMQKQAQPAGTN